MQENFSHVFFIGIGGIGMSALARYFNAKGLQVAGYDRTETVLTQKLQDEGIAVYYQDERTCIPAPYRVAEDCLVVYTPAIPHDADILSYFREQGFNIKKRAQVLGLLTQTQESICVAGTHGKTTISTMIGHLLYASEQGCSAFLGGISQNYQTNLLQDNKSRKVVIEADEFDRSFLNLYPHTAVISAIDADHLDIYGTHAELLDAFRAFSAQIVDEGILLYKEGLDFVPQVKAQVEVMTYNVDKGDFRTSNLHLQDGFYHFDFVTPNGVFPDMVLGIPGRVNVENAVAALAVAYLHGVAIEDMRKHLASFKGIKRRFEYHVRHQSMVYIDDYAHHPEELRATISSVRAIYPDRKITGIFQPHLYTRTQDFADDFAKALSLLDELWLMPIYPAREAPIPGVSSELIMSKVVCPVRLMTAEQIAERLQEAPIQVLLSLGAGDIDRLVPRITEVLTNRLNTAQ